MPKREPVTILVVAVVLVCALALPLGAGKAALGIAAGTGFLPSLSSPSAPTTAADHPAVVRNRAVSAQARSGARSAQARSGARSAQARSGARSAQARPAPQGKPKKKATPIPSAPGMQRSCSMTHRFPAAASSASIVKQVRKTWGVRLRGPSWKTKANRLVLKVAWQTLDAVDCTPFLSQIRAKNDGKLIVSGEKSGSWAWGDYGYSDPDGVSLSLDKMAAGIKDGQSPRVVRVMVHEMAHAWSADRDENSGYFAAFAKLGDSDGITEYGSQNTSENFAEAAGYYVARCAREQSDTGKPKANPYDDARNSEYYTFVGKLLFGQATFGPAAGKSC